MERADVASMSPPVDAIRLKSERTKRRNRKMKRGKHSNDERQSGTSSNHVACPLV